MKGSHPCLLALRLTVIVAVTALLLALVNAVTAPVIAERTLRESMAARAELIPGDAAEISLPAGCPAEVSAVYAITGDGQLRGYCVDAAANGFNGAVSMIVAVSPDLTVLGVKILSHSETPGAGSKALGDDSPLLSALYGVPARGLSGVEAVSGATYSSRAILSGVSAAVDVVELLEKEGA